MVRPAAWVESRQSRRPAASVTQTVALRVASTSQIVGGTGEEPPVFRTAPTRARRAPLAAAAVALALEPGENVPGPRNVRVPSGPRSTRVSFAFRRIRASGGT